MERGISVNKPEDDEVRAFDLTAEIACVAPIAVFQEAYENIPVELQSIIEQQNGLGCDGGGVPGEWCFRRTIEGCFWAREIVGTQSQQIGIDGPLFTSIELRPRTRT